MKSYGETYIHKNFLVFLLHAGPIYVIKQNVINKLLFTHTDTYKY